MNFSSFFRVIFRFKEFPPFTLRVILGSPSAEGDSSSRLSPSALFTTLSLETQPALPRKNFSPRFPPVFRKAIKKKGKLPFSFQQRAAEHFFIAQHGHLLRFCLFLFVRFALPMRLRFG